MATSFTQTTIYFPSGVGPEVDSQIVNQNVSGLGASQTVQLDLSAAVAANTVLSFPFQVAVPPPLLYFCTFKPGDELTIQSPDGLLISTTSFTPGVGDKGYEFQPSAGGKYIAYWKAGNAYAIGQPVIAVQAVLENTIGQFINIASISYSADENKVTKRPVVSQTIAINTTSAVPNTLNIDFENYPVRKGINTLATYKVLVTCSGVEAFGKDYLNIVGSSTRSVQLVAGQFSPITWYSPEEGTFSGRYSITISQSGQLSLPATVAAYGSPDVFPSLVANSPEMFTNITAESVDMSFLVSKFEELAEDFKDRSNGGSHSKVLVEMDGRLCTVEKVLMQGLKRMDEAHKKMNEVLGDLYHKFSVFSRPAVELVLEAE